MKKNKVLLTCFLLIVLAGCSEKAISLSEKNYFVEEGHNKGVAEFSEDGQATLSLNNQTSVTDYEVFPDQYEGYDGIVIDGGYYLAEQQDDVIYLWGVTENFSIDGEDDYFFKQVGNFEEVDMKLTLTKD
ncbi:hypothetical protein [Alkalibacterium sp. 20]|uniref:hypothetical protein n=1 Tax=Alkalibacterium sp. 20 TaxID=1798803 RepID=UPI000900203C|nr:hypothetical protein [Alkalibacterium sp. 20]OJF96189.1 hypothetical protein AX762_05500 [Alkalibacterium sp. 20]